ncbi:chorismate mutase [bacterium F16]|nr:chorismate mutase [bacterium F16]
MTSANHLSLETLRQTLIRQEETLIFAFIERAQFKQNQPCYTPGAMEALSGNQSMLDFFMLKTEELHALSRRYISPEEHAFNTALPKPLLPAFEWTAPIVQNTINSNDEIKRYYLDVIISKICQPGDCGNYGSSVTCDIICLQALSKRIHYGKFVAEAKFLAEPEAYTDLIQRKDTAGIMNQLVNKEVEHRVLKRVWNKASAYGRDPDFNDAAPKVLPDVIADIYQYFIIPLTCKVEVEYLLQRLD